MNDSDWILPGEFTFCGRCGRAETCRRGGDAFWCDRCRAMAMGWPRRPERPRRAAWLRRAMIRLGRWLLRRAGIETPSPTTPLADRRQRARQRREAGMPPLFWLAGRGWAEGQWRGDER